MSNVKSTFVNALLADATYVSTLSGQMTQEQLRNALQSRMTLTLATFIANNFEVVSHINKPDDLLSGGSGFDATAWRGRSGTEFAGQVFVSMRGTEGSQDFLTDVVAADRILTHWGCGVFLGLVRL